VRSVRALGRDPEIRPIIDTRLELVILILEGISRGPQKPPVSKRLVQLHEGPAKSGGTVGESGERLDRRKPRGTAAP
jgi:hypothetical protein